MLILPILREIMIKQKVSMSSTTKKIFLGCALILSFSLSSCTYMKYTSVQAKYSRLQNVSPSQTNLKHMLERDTFFVIGKTIDDSNKYPDVPMAIAAYSNKFKKNERVDTMYFSGSGTHFGLNLPPGSYNLVVFADIDRNGKLQQTEIIGIKKIDLILDESQEKIVSNVSIELGGSKIEFNPEPFPMRQQTEDRQSLFYPTGTIRSLNDPIFNENMATLGMYDPASFLENIPTMFFALEEDQIHKIPVVFAHGIDGSSRSFSKIIDGLDRDRYKPWFFYYPSGGDLDQLADFFYKLFLSGEVITLGPMPMIVVAHSMGGLIVREAMNKYEGNSKENNVELFVSIASPLGGHPDAKLGVEKGLIVLPSWQDLDPSSRFIKNLYRKPLPTFVNHQLFYAYKNSGTLKLGENSDGVVPLSSQLHHQAQQQSSKQHGFDSGHLDILENEEMNRLLLNSINQVKNFFPDSHMKILKDGGLNLNLSNKYDPKTKHLISYSGRYILKLINGTIEPFYPEQAKFVRVVQGKEQATLSIEKEFIRLVAEYPELFNEEWQEY